VRNFIKNRIVIGLIFFILGGAITYGVLQSRAKNQSFTKNMNPLLDEFYGDNFFDTSRDPFEQMRKMRERFGKEFGDFDEGRGFFDSWYKNKFGGGNVGEINQREDDNFVYYDISIKGIKREDVKVEVNDRQVNITGQSKTGSDDSKGDSQTFSSSTFRRSFPTPAGVNSAKVEVEYENDKMILKFPKSK
jgi:HSP20 family molecular chaperone IbpA